MTTTILTVLSITGAKLKHFLLLNARSQFCVLRGVSRCVC